MGLGLDVVEDVAATVEYVAYTSCLADTTEGELNDVAHFEFTGESDEERVLMTLGAVGSGVQDFVYGRRKIIVHSLDYLEVKEKSAALQPRFRFVMLSIQCQLNLLCPAVMPPSVYRRFDAQIRFQDIAAQPEVQVTVDVEKGRDNHDHRFKDVENIFCHFGVDIKRAGTFKAPARKNNKLLCQYLKIAIACGGNVGNVHGLKIDGPMMGVNDGQENAEFHVTTFEHV